MIDKPKLTPPNEKGFQFGVNDNLTKYAHKCGVTITAVEVWKDGRIVTMLLMNEETNEAMKECNGFEAAAVAIDAFAALKKFNESEK